MSKLSGIIACQQVAYRFAWAWGIEAALGAAMYNLGALTALYELESAVVGALELAACAWFRWPVTTGHLFLPQMQQSTYAAEVEGVTVGAAPTFRDLVLYPWLAVSGVAAVVVRGVDGDSCSGVGAACGWGSCGALPDG